MNYTKQQKFHLSLTKKLVKHTDSDAFKENNSAAANENLDIFKVKNTYLKNFENSFASSQNFRLRLSDESEEKLPSYNPKYKNQYNDTTVSISDSNHGSSNDNSPLKNLDNKQKSRIYPTPYHNDRPLATIVIESSDSDGLIALDSDDDSVLNNLKTDKKDSTVESERSKNFAYRDKIRFDRRSKASKSSEDSTSTRFSPAEINSSRNKIISESSSSEDVNKELGMFLDAKRSQENRNGSKFSDRWKRKSSSSDESNPRSNNFGNVTSRSTTKPYDPVKLTKKDAERIFKGIKVAGNPHWTPKLTSTSSHLDIESLTDYAQGLRIPKIIDETKSQNLMTESSSEDEIISNSSTDLKLTKTHISRFMINTPVQENQYSSLSDRKKNDISHWLMNNTPGSSSSSSIVSESNRNSSFGNSSLERFELKHETPNNRGKISKPGTTDKVESVPKGIERFIYTGKTSVVKNQTPGVIEDLTEGKLKADQAVPKKKTLPIVKAVENLHIEDCADILDKLYGHAWRNKADAVFTPKTEPRLDKISTNGEKSKTERKHVGKSCKAETKILPTTDEDDFDLFSKDIRPNFNSTKKKTVRDSFIEDESSSESSSESFYHTALTNPRESKDFRNRIQPKTVSASTIKAIAICDTDSSDTDENYPSVRISGKDLNRKRLSFSDDASNSSTSEFDPGELVLPKPKAKKAPAKTIRQLSKAPEVCKSKSFLASLSATVPIQNCHPEARVYRENYKNKKEQLCKYLFQLYNKNVFDEKLPNDMPIEWNVRMRGTAGFCYNRKSVKALGGIVRSSRIVLATKILDTPDRLRDTLIHEMCHAAAWLINNVSDGHGPYWKGWASKAVKTFPELPPIKRCHDYKIKTKYTYRCTKCGYSIGRHSKSLNTESKRCGHCYGKFELLINRETRSGTVQAATPVQTRPPTGFALFVKENYHSVKKDRRSMKHAEVMKILGQQFAAVKIVKKVD